MKRFLLSLTYHILLAGVIFFSGIAAHAFNAWSKEPIPRVIISLYDSRKGERIDWTRVHVLASMPLNHLGLKVEQHNLADGLPDIAHRKDVRGVLTWFQPGTVLDNSQQYIDWASKVIDSGKKFVILGDFAFFDDASGHGVSLDIANKFLAKIGIKTSGEWVNATYHYNILSSNPSMVGFERKYDEVKSPYYFVTPVDKSTQSYLVLGKKDAPSTQAHLITIGKHGAYVAAGYEFYNPDNAYISESRQWYINPFAFFRAAFETDDLPKPDTTTLAGRRIYYSHIDGDGWNNVSLIENYYKTYAISAEVILKEAVIPYLDLPVTVSPIAADIDPEWFATQTSRKIAKKLFELPNVEAGSHTYTHPFDWGFFEDGNIEKERPFLSRYQGKIWDKTQEIKNLVSVFNTKNPQYHDHSVKLSDNYSTPRAYAFKPFDINMEIKGSLDAIAPLLPKGKHIAILQWSGDTKPFEKAIALTKEAGIKNINGGDSRFDTEHPSRMWLAPIGLQVGNYRQIYASTSNENTYTNLWTGRYHGFRYLKETLDNTETPIRLKPFNVYYHMYSGERDASLNAILGNLNYARKQELAPVTASHFAAIAEGFFSADIIPVSTNAWQIENRGELTTIRFDNKTFSRVDFSRSKGVVGQRLHQGSLYVYLDDKASSPVIALKTVRSNAPVLDASQPYLIESRWQVMGYKHNPHRISFSAQGYGYGEMKWYVPQNGPYEVVVPGLPNETIWVNNHQLSLKLPMIGINGIEVQLLYRGNT